MNVGLFGELLLRLTTPGHQRFVQAHGYEAHYTGGEANAGVVLANLGASARLISAVPDHDVGTACLNHMRGHGLSTDFVLRQGNRLGILFVEHGASHRASQVIYDRRGSAFSRLRVGDIDWQAALRGLNWLHFTGTAPALSDELAELTLEGCQAANEMGITVSCDLGYRSALWSIDKASEVMRRIVPHVDALIANEEQAALILGEAAATEHRDPFSAERYDAQLNRLRDEYGLRHIVFTIRQGDTADETSIAAVISDQQAVAISQRYDLRVVDRVGGGDALAGAAIFGLLQQWEGTQVVNFAVAASALKHTVPGDFAHFTLNEVKSLMAGASAGRVRR